MPDSLPLVKGTLDVLVLKALSWTPMHGFEITTWLEGRSGGALGSPGQRPLPGASPSRRRAGWPPPSGG
jgi:hypothetical protein